MLIYIVQIAEKCGSNYNTAKELQKNLKIKRPLIISPQKLPDNHFCPFVEVNKARQHLFMSLIIVHSDDFLSNPLHLFVLVFQGMFHCKKLKI